MIIVHILQVHWSNVCMFLVCYFDLQALGSVFYTRTRTLTKITLILSNIIPQISHSMRISVEWALKCPWLSGSYHAKFNQVSAGPLITSTENYSKVSSFCGFLQWLKMICFPCRLLEKKVKQLMSERGDYKAWYYMPINERKVWVGHEAEKDMFEKRYTNKFQWSVSAHWGTGLLLAMSQP